MQKVDAEIRHILDTQYALARHLIETERDKVEAIAQALLEWETIDREQMDDIMEGRPPRPPKDWTPTDEPAEQARRRSRSTTRRPRPDALPSDAVLTGPPTGPRAPFCVSSSRLPDDLADQPLSASTWRGPG